jgi:hypothetical protein
MAIENGAFIIKTETSKNTIKLSNTPQGSLSVSANKQASLSSIPLKSENSINATLNKINGLNAEISSQNNMATKIEKNISTTLNLSTNQNIQTMISARGLPGRGIVSVEKTSSAGLVDTYTITYTDKTTSTFEVTNGDGSGGTTNYENLTNLPSINGITLVGNKTTEDLLIERSGDKTYHHKQTTASDTWTIIHNLNKYPSVNVINSAGDEVIGDVIYNDINQITIKFKGSFKGSATLN